jgi:CRP-like cAMP-binding protein
MFEYLFNDLTTHKTLSEEETGRVLDHLRAVPYFNAINSALGADYLDLLLPLLQPYILRAGFTLVGEDSLYLLLDGSLREVERLYEADRTIEPNRLLDLRDKPGVRFEAESDCRIIKIRKGAAAGLAHFQKRLIKKERERTQEMAKLKRLAKGKEHREKLEFLQVIDFFSGLGEFDLLDLTVQSHIKEYSQGSITHACGEDIEAVGCVLSGKVKLSFPTNKDSKQAVSVFLTDGEWIGLEEYLWESSFRSNGEAASISVMIVWIPRDVFRSKFNLKTNYGTMNRLVSLIETKKALFDRSFDCRKRKEGELTAEGEALRCINTQLLEKISAMTMYQ